MGELWQRYQVFSRGFANESEVKERRLPRALYKQGLSLLETLLAVLLMTLTLWGVQSLYLNLLAGTRSSDERREALAEAESLLSYWQHQAQETWPSGPAEYPHTEAYTVEEQEHGKFAYRVEVSGRLPSPNRLDPDSSKPKVLELQLVKLTLFYSERGSEGHRVTLQGTVSD